MTLQAANTRLSTLAPEQRLAVARLRAYERMPYFASGIRSLVPRHAPGLGTLGVTKSSILLTDYQVLGEWTVDEGGSVILHEYMHRYLNHHERWERMLKQGVLGPEDWDLWGKATDAEINDNLVEAGCPLPKVKGADPITPVGLGLELHRSAEEYAMQLKQQRARGDIPPSPGTSPTPGWGGCGSGAGASLPGEPPEDDPAGRSDVEQHVQRRADSEQIRVAARSSGRGSVPAGLARFAEAHLEPPKVRWQDQLSHAARSAVAAVQGAGDYTQTERSRMQGGLEAALGADAPVLPGEHTPLAEVVVGVDTSGSMSDGQQGAILAEVEGILRQLSGARISFIAVDAVVHTVARVRTVAEIKEGLKGGGGTDFRPFFEALPGLRPRPNVVVFATDGCGPAPRRPPAGMRVVWLIVDGQAPWVPAEEFLEEGAEDREVKWGTFIHIESGGG